MRPRAPKNCRVTSLNLDPDVIEALVQKGYNLSSTVREDLRLLLEGELVIEADMYTEAELLSQRDEITARINELKDEYTPQLRVLEELKQEFNKQIEGELNDLRSVNDRLRFIQLRKTSIKAIAPRIVAETERDKWKKVAIEAFNTWITKKKEKGLKTYEYIVEVGTEEVPAGVYSFGVYHEFWMSGRGLLPLPDDMGGMDLRFKCGFPFMEPAVKFLKENTKINLGEEENEPLGAKEMGQI